MFHFATFLFSLRLFPPPIHSFCFPPDIRQQHQPSPLLPEKHRASFLKNIVRCHTAASPDGAARPRSTLCIEIERRHHTPSLDAVIRDRATLSDEIARCFFLSTGDPHRQALPPESGRKTERHAQHKQLPKLPQAV
ncbi:hypothetical protein [Candidatus Electronema sp. JM]|uniref:hypothetical protein n=1 Tax=Candidatus Electronema sp. JM TaxID=3401571 RepID=UPI003AA87BBA